MADVVLKLDHLTKTYILGKRKNAAKAQKAIQKLQTRYEKAFEKNDQDLAKQLEDKLNRAQELFADDKYGESYTAVTGKPIKDRPKDRGTVVHALNNVSLDIIKGDLVAIMGPSGSGKSTLLNMLGLLDQPTAGQIYLQGRNVTAIRPRALPSLRSHQLGFVFQSFNLIPTMTSIENVMLPLRYAGMGRSRRKHIAHRALELVGLSDRENHTSNELSGGQRQRVAIARSLVNNPAIIFGDELTGELDSKMTADIMKLITALNRRGQTFIIVTHNPDVAKHCRRIIVMRDGKIDKEIDHDGKSHVQLG